GSLRALGRARTMGRVEGLVKVIADPENNLVLGVGMVGPHVSELISEGTLAIEMGATLEDLMVTVHPHPTLSEALMEAAEVAAGAPIHLPPVKK
ncbi:dihydrolipoyl dehydrogenase, partial [Gemmatimonadota bacterium]